MAGRAGCRRRRRVRSGQGESGHAVIECRRSPACCRMAIGTIRRRKGGSGSRVHGSICLLPGCQVALRVAAIGRRDRQGIVVVDVAQIAGHVGMPVGQQETGRAVVECRCGPTSRCVACRAIRKRKGRPG